MSIKLRDTKKKPGNQAVAENAAQGGRTNHEICVFICIE